MKNMVISWIGAKIKALRNQQSLSLKELSNYSNVSKSLLSKIENNRTIPSLPVFMNILEALEVAPKDFFEDLYINDGKHYIVVRKEDRVSIEKEGRHGFSYQSILNQNLSNLTIDIVHLTVQPEASYEATITDGYEFKLILTGEVEYVIGDESTLLSQGDAIFFDARTPHFPKSTKEEVQMLVIYFLFG